MTREAMEIITNALQSDESKYTEKIDKALALVQKALEQEPCEDAISRQAVLDINHKHHGEMPNHINHEIWAEINSLPSVNPKPKTGRWIRVDKDKLRCSECEVIHLIAQYPNGKIDWCPNCGAKMESEG